MSIARAVMHLLCYIILSRYYRNDCIEITNLWLDIATLVNRVEKQRSNDPSVTFTFLSMTFVDDLRNRVLFTSVHGIEELLMRNCYEIVGRRFVGCKIGWKVVGNEGKK